MTYQRICQGFHLYENQSAYFMGLSLVRDGMAPYGAG
jgi:hypothetical protein